MQSSHLAEIKRGLPSFSSSIIIKIVKYHSSKAVDLLAICNLDMCISCLSRVDWQHGYRIGYSIFCCIPIQEYYRRMSLSP